MNKSVQIFLDEVCSCIKCRAVHKDVREELKLHIEERMQDNLKAGMREEDAIENAIAAMGNSGEIGAQLNRQHKPQTEWLLIALTGLFIVFGMIIMYISSGFENQNILFSKHLVYVVLGIGAMIGLYFFDYTKLKKWAVPLYIGAMLLLIVTYFAGVRVNGAKRWLAFGSFCISSAEIASVLLIAAFSGFLQRYEGQGTAAIVKLAAIGLISVLPVVMQPNLGMVLILIITYAAVLFCAVFKNYFGGNRKKQVMIISVLGACFILIFLFFGSDYRLERIIGFLTGGREDYIQMIVGKWLAASNLFGKAGAVSEGALEMTVPGITNEYVLVNMIVNLGWAAGAVLLLTAGIFIGRLFLTVKKVKSDYGYYLSLAACVLLSVQLIVNICINFNLFPFVGGVAMPFVSYGGSGYLVSMALVGIILSVWRRNNILGHDTENVSRAKRVLYFTDGKIVFDFKIWKS